jgi:hypothetical protein
MTSWYHESWVFALAMSSISGQGAGSKDGDMLTAIFKQLAAMDKRLCSMETKLGNVDAMQAKVSALEESTGELDAQQDTLSSAVERIDLAQMQLAANAGRGTTAPCDPPHGRPQFTTTASAAVDVLAVAITAIAVFVVVLVPVATGAAVSAIGRARRRGRRWLGRRGRSVGVERRQESRRPGTVHMNLLQ